MGALAKSGFTPEDAAVAAVEAGVDFIMMSEKHYDKVYSTLLERYVTDESFKQKVHNSAERIIKLKIKLDVLRIVPDSGSGYTLESVPLQSTQYRKDHYKDEYAAASALYKKIINGGN
jgi:beta-glucosidase-like glycosyl hydrolase